MKKLLALMLAAMMLMAGCLTDSGDDSSDNSGDNGGSTTTGYTVSGTIKDASGNALAGIVVTLGGAGTSGTTILTATTGTDGTYSFTGIANGQYVVTPVPTTYTFTPGYRSITVLLANLPSIDFVGATGGSTATYTVGGTIKNSSGAALAGITVALSGTVSGTIVSLTATTGTDGSYSFTGVANGTYIITPAPINYTFTPGYFSVTVSGADITGKDFAAASGGGATTGYSVSGRIHAPGNIGVPGITVTIEGTAIIPKVTTTDSNGNYSFSDIPNGTYMVVPVKEGAIFTPLYQDITVNSANLANVDFIDMTSVSTTYSISGTVKTASGAAISGVEVMLVGSGLASVYTDASGNYTITGLSAGIYVVSIDKTGYTFDPDYRSATITTANITGIDFTGTVESTTTYSISGTIETSTGSPVSGVTLAISGPVTTTATTGSDGTYTFSGLSNGTYYIVPDKDNYTFTPPYRNITVSGANQTGVDFSGATSGGTGTGDAGTHAYYPAKLGASWTWTSVETNVYTNETYNSEYTDTITGTTEFDGKTYWVVSDESGNDISYNRIEGNIVYQYTGGGMFKTFASAIKKANSAAKVARTSEIYMPNEIGMINLGVSVGESYTIMSLSGSEIGYDYNVSAIGTYVGNETVSVTAGTFSNCKKFVVNMTYTISTAGFSQTSSSKATMWAAQGVGPVKSIDSNEDNGIETYSETATLKSYNIP